MSKEVYHSSTMGPIPLSFTGRHLLQSLREEVEELLRATYALGKKGHARPQDDWEPVSRARGRLAKYMSELEAKREPFAVAVARDVETQDRLRKAWVQFGGVPAPFPASAVSYRWTLGCPGVQFGGVPVRNTYIVTYVGEQNDPPGDGKIMGSVWCKHSSMEEAVIDVIGIANRKGFSVKPSDFTVRLAV